jgi:hypothetical protein
MISVSLLCGYSPRKVKSSNKMESPPPEKIAICLGKHDTEEQTNTEQGIDSWAPFKKFRPISTKRVVVPARQPSYTGWRNRFLGIYSWAPEKFTNSGSDGNRCLGEFHPERKVTGTFFSGLAKFVFDYISSYWPVFIKL